MQTITKVYNTYLNARNAVAELETAGIPVADISVLANQSATQEFDINRDTNNEDIEEESEAVPGAGLGAVVGGTAGLLTGLGLLAIPGLGPVVAAGWLATTALGLVAGGATGGIVGSLIGAGVPEDHAEVYSEAVRRGGTLVSVKTQDHNASTVHAILDNHTPIDPNEQGVALRINGWKGFDANGEPYEATPLSADRNRHTM